MDYAGLPSSSSPAVSIKGRQIIIFPPFFLLVNCFSDIVMWNFDKGLYCIMQFPWENDGTRLGIRGISLCNASEFLFNCSNSTLYYFDSMFSALIFGSELQIMLF